MIYTSTLLHPHQEDIAFVGNIYIPNTSIRISKNGASITQCTIQPIPQKDA